MSKPMRFFTGGIVSGFIAACLGTQTIGHPNSAYIPLVIFFGVLSVLLAIIGLIAAAE